MRQCGLFAIIAIASISVGNNSALAQCADTAASDVVCTEQGPVRGTREGETFAYKGIPYAAPPTGERRWHPPEPAQTWEGIHDASEFGPPCPQLAGDRVVGDENCLFLNIWTPLVRSEALLPVMVYLTGGGNRAQSGAGGASVDFNGSKLVPNDVVLVTFNIRLGALGFLTHPSLDRESSDGVSGNYGNRDQIAMLTWLRNNIADFGGDPDNIFLFGTSAGGANICALMSSPLAQGLFHAAAMQSSVPTGCEIHTLADAQERTGYRLASAIGCDEETDVAQCLRSKSPEELLLALDTTAQLSPRVYGPVMDGMVFPDQPRTRIEAGLAARIPVIIGNTAEETWYWLDRIEVVEDEASYAAALRRLFGEDHQEDVLAQYPAARYSSAREAWLRATTDAFFTCQTRRVARALAADSGTPVYRYIFDHTLSSLPDSGASHSQEHALFFQFKAGEGPEDERVSAQLVSYWVNMAKYRDPNGTTTAKWEPISADSDRYLRISVVSSMEESVADENCDFWDRTPLPWPHM